MKRKSRHGSPPENASRRNIATVSHSRMHYSYILPMKSPAAARKYSMLVSRHASSALPSGTGSAVVGAASGIGSASAGESNHGVEPSAAGWALGHGTAVGCGRTLGHGTAAAHGRGVAGCGRAPRHGAGTVGCEPDHRQRHGLLRTAFQPQEQAMPKTRMNPFTPTFPRYCTVIGFICYVTNI